MARPSEAELAEALDVLRSTADGRLIWQDIQANGISGNGTSEPDDSQWDDTNNPLLPYNLVDWSEAWNADLHTADWLIDPLIASGRGHAIYAAAGTGKSWSVLAACAALAAGRAFLNTPAGQPRHVLYLDYEMTLTDLLERLEMFGYGPDDDLSHLHYALIPALPPLDTEPGGTALVELAWAVGAELVAIDTSGRALQGDENDADSIRAYYRHTGQRLKAAGVATVRIDHAGKDADKGQRGTSAKNDDVDIIWQIVRTDEGQKWTARKRRTTWVPEVVRFTVAEGTDGVFTFTGDGPSWQAGTKDCAADLDRYGVAVEGTVAEAMKALRDHGVGRRKAIVVDAVRYRRNLWITVESDGSSDREPRPEPYIRSILEPSAEPSGTDHENSMKPTGTTTGTAGNRQPEPLGTFPHPYKGAESLRPPPSPDTTDDEEDWL